jgi:hypothetical protein
MRLRDRKVIVTKQVKFAKKKELDECEDLLPELEPPQKTKEADKTKAVGVQSGKAGAENGAGDTVKPVGAVRRSEREHKPPERLSLFVGPDRGRKAPLRF